MQEFRVEGKKYAYDIPIHVSGSIDNHVHFEERVNNSIRDMAQAQLGISEEFGEQNDIHQRELKNQAMVQYSDAVSQLVVSVNSTDEKTVKSLIDKINDSLRLFNFDEERFYSSLENFSNLETYVFDLYNNAKGDIDLCKEDFFARNFVRSVIETNGYGKTRSGISFMKSEMFSDMIYRALPTVDSFLTDRYIEYTKKVKDVVSELSLLQFSNKTGIDIRMNTSPDFFRSEKEMRDIKEKEGTDEEYDDVSQFKVFVVLDDKPQYKEKGRYKQVIYDMNCSMEKFFDRLVYEEPETCSFTEFFEKNGLPYEEAGSKTTGLHIGENEITIIAKDLAVIADLDSLADYNTEILGKSESVQKKKSDKR